MTNNQPNLSSPLKILLWNANGLSKHKNELKTALNDLKIDIALITETHFTEFSIFNYTLYKTNHSDGTTHAGSCILVSNSIQYNILTSFQEPSIQTTSNSIKINSISITISSIYCPPRHAIQRDFFLRFFNTLGHHFIAGDDFNAKHSQWAVSPITKEEKHSTLSKIIVNYRLCLHLDPPTGLHIQIVTETYATSS
jgi:exonuclease III